MLLNWSATTAAWTIQTVSFSAFFGGGRVCVSALICVTSHFEVMLHDDHRQVLGSRVQGEDIPVVWC